MAFYYISTISNFSIYKLWVSSSKIRIFLNKNSEKKILKAIILVTVLQH